MLKWTFIIAFAVTTAALLLAGWAGHETIYMNGCLCDAHAEMERDCTVCHRPWQSNRIGKAMCSSETCHPSIRKEAVHVVPEVTLECEECHVEHKGRATNLHIAQVNWLCEDCHREEISGSNHRFVFACYNCHYYHYPSPKAPPVERTFEHLKNPHGDHLELIATLLELEGEGAACQHCHGVPGRSGAVRSATHATCAGTECHQNLDRSKPTAECKQCHTLCDRSSKTGIKFSHAGHTKEKIEVGCDECHLVKTPDSTFVKLNKTFCLECHDVKHDTAKDIASKECAYCHTASAPVKVAHLKFAHEEHAELACAKCHPNLAKASELKPLAMLTAAHCGTCHTETGIRVP